MWQPVLNELPDLLPTAIAPIFECVANYDIFRKTNIVPHWEKNNDKLKEYEKFDARTSNFAKFVGKQFDISPRYVDHVLLAGRLCELLIHCQSLAIKATTRSFLKIFQ